MSRLLIPYIDSMYAMFGLSTFNLSNKTQLNIFNLYDIWKPPSLSELTLYLIALGLTSLGLHLILMIF